MTSKVSAMKKLYHVICATNGQSLDTKYKLCTYHKKYTVMVQVLDELKTALQTLLFKNFFLYHEEKKGRSSFMPQNR